MNNNTNASERSFNGLQGFVFNPSYIADGGTDSGSTDKGDKKKDYRSAYSIVKKNAKELFQRFDQSGVFKGIDWKEGEPLRLFLKHCIFFQKNYNEESFKHDFAGRMATLMSDRRIVRACKAAKLNLFDTVQNMTWENQKVLDDISKVGLKNVELFRDGNSWANKRDLIVYSVDDLKPYFILDGMDEDDWSSSWMD